MTKSTLKYEYEFKIKKDGKTPPLKDVFISDNAKEMMGKVEQGVKEDITLQVFRADTLGVDGWTETDFFGEKGFKHLQSLGLAKCSPDDAFYLRESYKDQPIYEWIRVAHDPISADGYSRVFHVGHHSDCGRCLNGFNLNSYYELYADSLLAGRVASPLDSDTKTLPSDTLNLELAIEMVKEAGYQVSKIL